MTTNEVPEVPDPNLPDDAPTPETDAPEPAGTGTEQNEGTDQK